MHFHAQNTCARDVAQGEGPRSLGNLELFNWLFPSFGGMF